MLGNRLLAICLTVITGSIAYSAVAQDCDERFSRGCQGYGQPRQPPIFPWMQQPGQIAPSPPPTPPGALVRPGLIAPPVDFGLRRDYAALYAQIDGEPFPIPAVQLSDIGAEFLRRAVNYPTTEAAGTIVIDPPNHFLYFVQGGGRAIRYGVGVGREGFGWSGVATIHDKQEWPDWYPPKEMIARQPELRRQMNDLEGGLGMPGGLRNPLGSPRDVPLARQQGHSLPHPRYRRAMDHRQERVLRLHPHDKPGCHRPLSAHGGRRQGSGASVALLVDPWGFTTFNRVIPAAATCINNGRSNVGRSSTQFSATVILYTKLPYSAGHPSGMIWDNPARRPGLRATSLNPRVERCGVRLRHLGGAVTPQP
jgi:lipoprotein-anchoring transpeptidase ErfK/SrfK